MKFDERHRAFFKALMQQPTSLASAMKKAKVGERALHNWLRSRWFRQRLRRLMSGWAQKRELEVSRGATSAAQTLASVALDETDQPLADARRKVMVDLIRLARWRAPKRGPALQRDASESDEPLIAGEMTDDDVKALSER
jgi:hypothetical protein